MVNHIPTRVKKPTDPDEPIGTKTFECKIGYDCRKREFPYPKAAIQICGSCASDHDGIEVSSVWLSEERASTDVKQRHKYRTH